MLFFTGKQKQYLLILYILGIVTGTFVFQYVYQTAYSDISIYGRIIFNTTNLKRIEKGSLLLYVFRYRIKMLLILLLFSLTFIKKILHGVVVWASGMRYSLLISFLTVLDTKKAFLNFVEIILPQEVLYILGGLMIISISWNLDYESWSAANLSRSIKKILTVIVVYFFAIVFEVYINPLLLQFVSL